MNDYLSPHVLTIALTFLLAGIVSLAVAALFWRLLPALAAPAMPAG